MPDPQQVMERLRESLANASRTHFYPDRLITDALTALSEAQEREKRFAEIEERLKDARVYEMWHSGVSLRWVRAEVFAEQAAELSRFRAENEELKAAFRQALRGSR